MTITWVGTSVGVRERKPATTSTTQTRIGRAGQGGEEGGWTRDEQQRTLGARGTNVREGFGPQGKFV